MSAELFTAVNKQVANWTVLYVKLHNYHWLIKGHHFFTLHEKFEEYYNEASANIDELAERILSIGGKPVGTIKECLELSSIKEASGTEAETEMVQAIHNDFATIVNELKGAIELAEQNNDQGTADILIGIQKNLRKHMWMLQAFLGQGVSAKV
ncbi:DNA starvation/stationary phase protection protein [Bacillus sp. T3]|uniref:Dps family protein n=1 Tax=Bacillus sp. T3 TaxID=467262 RepID=UPI0029825030|nr:DNA starvation/stationary phase protection protein [Bacillus sp. T3]